MVADKRWAELDQTWDRDFFKNHAPGGGTWNFGEAATTFDSAPEVDPGLEPCAAGDILTAEAADPSLFKNHASGGGTWNFVEAATACDSAPEVDPGLETCAAGNILTAEAADRSLSTHAEVDLAAPDDTCATSNVFAAEHMDPTLWEWAQAELDAAAETFRQLGPAAQAEFASVFEELSRGFDQLERMGCDGFDELGLGS